MTTNDEYPESPVLSDKELSEGELPFTAFGQFGENSLDLRVFEQDVWWVNKLGEPFKLEEMSSDYLSNVEFFLIENLYHFYLGFIEKTTIDILLDVMDGKTNSEVLSHELGHGLLDQTPESWLSGTPLMRKIVKLLGD